MKQLIFINGTMGVGKSTTCRELNKLLTRSVWLDGDWCWTMQPWSFCEENKKMVLENIVFLLQQFLTNSNFDYVIFCWVMHEPEISRAILQRLTGLQYELQEFTLICSEDELRQRMLADGRALGVIENSVQRLEKYNLQNTVKIMVNNITPAAVADAIAARIENK